MKKLVLLSVVGVTALLGGCGNASDVADTQNMKADLAKVVEAGVVQPVDSITSAGQPDEAALNVFAESGYVAVIDMRGPEERRGLDERVVVEELGMEYVPFPIVGSDAISFENAKELDGLLSEYDGPVLLHCGSGNRVGALLALRLSLSGADDGQAIDYGRSAGLTGLEPVVKERLAQK